MILNKLYRYTGISKFTCCFSCYSIHPVGAEYFYVPKYVAATNKQLVGASAAFLITPGVPEERYTLKVIDNQGINHIYYCEANWLNSRVRPTTWKLK